MNQPRFQKTLDTLLHQSVHRRGGVPGVVAMVTGRNGNLYEGAAGVRELGDTSRPMDTGAVFAIFSTTKAMTAACALQLVEEGLLSLDDPADRYLPEIGELGVLTGFDAAGQPQTRAPKRRITVNDLFLHTSGLGYEFFSSDDQRYRAARGVPGLISCTAAAMRSVLLHDPGECWSYGVNIDWLGRIVETIRGKRLGDVMRERLFAPLDMTDIGFTMTPSMRERRVTIHERGEHGQLAPLPELVLPQPPEMDCGGHGLYATVGEYMKFIRMILNDGMGPHGRVLKPETIAMMGTDGLAALGLSSTAWTTANPSLVNSGEFLPGQDKGWSYSFLVNRETAPTGRPAGSLMWAGLANCYFWIDRQTGIGGYWASQVLPFQDAAAYPGFLEFERAVYDSCQAVVNG
ncbi:serine hydrolase [Duganella sp. FT92W]|uniref:Serine hydrolase n=1 Tax=Pseudoduganella rivuli TaxID=2666085 RepID=A0A7X2IIQ0_9BURK|nr:serine hydrolase domain-containing protein [Pseudoduganella rivuli]MRV70393.1 serine hydrolase [Pseudoduganella rivuli]